MALPKFNDTPIYETTIPSISKKIKFRPFLVKEQKILMIAHESQDQRQIARSILDTIESCIQEEISTKTLTSFDIEYLFLNIRAKSVGENVDLLLPCTSDECNHSTQVSINLEEIKLEGDKPPPIIKLNDQYELQLRYPRYDDIIEIAGAGDVGLTEQMYAMMQACMGTLLSEDERIDFTDESKEEISEFLDSLPTKVFEQIVSFTQDLPALKYKSEYVCSECGKENERTIEGLADFLQYASPTTI